MAFLQPKFWLFLDQILKPEVGFRLVDSILIFMFSLRSTYEIDFFNRRFRVSKKVEGGQGFFLKNENLPHTITP